MQGSHHIRFVSRCLVACLTDRRTVVIIKLVDQPRINHDYILIVSPRLIDTATGQIVWSEQLRKFKSEIYTKKHGKNVMAVFASRHIPDMAESLSSEVAGSLGR